jgi:hypothetical protein
MAPYRKQPDVVAPYPPAGYIKKQPVGPADNWWSLQPLLQTEDPWDLIYFNFRTYNPDEVNWYLYEKVGCRGATANGLNYRFDSGDPTKQLAIYIPPWDFRGPGPKQKEAQQAALTVLRGSIASGLHFRLGSVSLRPGDLLAIADLIENGRITLIHRPTLGHMAIYDSQRNRMAIPFDRLPPIGSQALIVHEAVHAAMDMQRTKLTSIESELIAYVAQALFLRRAGQDLGDSVPSPAFSVNPTNFVAWTGIFKSAAAIADRIEAGEDPGLYIATLGISMLLTETYSKQGAPPNDGI